MPRDGLSAADAEITIVFVLSICSEDCCVLDTATACIVEDDAAVRRLLQCTLEEQGLRCACYECVHEFLDNYDPRVPGCLLLDIQLPDGDGIDLLREARRRGWRVPTIVLTAFGGVASAVTAMKLGAVEYMQKPFEPAELVSKVRAAMALDVAERKQASELAALIRRFAELTPREHELLKLLVAGNANKEIARTLGVALKTAINHRAHLMAKVQATNAADLVRLATLAGYSAEAPAAIATITAVEPA